MTSWFAQVAICSNWPKVVILVYSILRLRFWRGLNTVHQLTLCCQHYELVPRANIAVEETLLSCTA